MVGVSTAAVNSALQRARAQLEQAKLTEDDVVEPTDAASKELLAQYATAMEQKDISAMIGMFTADAVWEMPPFPGWYAGPADIGVLIDKQCPAGPGELLLTGTRSNGQPAYGVYIRTGDGWEAFQLQVLTLAAGGGISHVAAFFDLSLFRTFGLPMTLPLDTS
jgi:RNA polymerase sigma-70 factor (ECF subfamily)